MSIAARLPRPVATLDPKRIAATSLAIAVHGVVLMMLLMPMQVADPPARLDTPMVVLPIHTIPPPVDPPPRDERPRPVIRQTQTTPRPVEVPVLNTDRPRPSASPARWCRACSWTTPAGRPRAPSSRAAAIACSTRPR